MSTSNVHVTYAQYGEDVILDALLSGVDQGFYIDVGANYPVVDSVTKRFYDKGWSGINIEPIPSLYKQLVAKRKRDITLQCGLGAKEGSLTFREFVDVPGHSTFEASAEDDKAGANYIERTIKLHTLNYIFNKYVQGRKVHFIKIDVEGYEYQVIEGNDWQKNRPEVICIEANHVINDWRPLLTRAGYRLFIADGLNEYYVANESWYRTEGYAERAIELTYYSLRQYQYEIQKDYQKQIKQLTDANHFLANALKEMQERYDQLQHLSLQGRSLLGRAKVSGYGLTVDFVKHRRSKRRKQ